MNQSGLVRGVQPFASRGDNLNRFIDIEFASAFHLVAQRISLHIFADYVCVSVRQQAEIDDGGDLRMSEIEGDLRFDLKAILRSRLGHRARAYELDGDFMSRLVRRYEDHSRSALIYHTLQPITRVDPVRDRLDVPQFDEA